MSKTVIPFTAKLVKFDTAVPFADVISRLHIAVNKEDSGVGNIMAKLKLVNTQDEFTAVVNNTVGDSGFLCVRSTQSPSFPTDFKCTLQILHGSQATQVAGIRGR